MVGDGDGGVLRAAADDKFQGHGAGNPPDVAAGLDDGAGTGVLFRDLPLYD